MADNQTDLPGVPPGTPKIVKSAEQLAKISQASGLDFLAQAVAKHARMVEEMNRLALSDLDTIISKATTDWIDRVSAPIQSSMVEMVKQIHERYTAMFNGLLKTQASWLTELVEIAPKIDTPPVNIRTHGPEFPVLPELHAFRHIRKVVKLTDINKVNRHLSKGWTLIAWDVDGGNAVFLLGWEGAEDPPKDDDAGEWVPPIGRA